MPEQHAPSCPQVVDVRRSTGHSALAGTAIHRTRLRRSRAHLAARLASAGAHDTG
jgi:hypothetical protein